MKKILLLSLLFFSYIFIHAQNQNNNTVISDYGCVKTTQLQIDFTDCSPKISFPNVFTPNSDGYNDRFYPEFENIEEYEIAIYNKWGTKVFETDDITEAWDGTYEGNKCSAGVYCWVAAFSTYKENELFEENLRGTVDIVRE